MSYCLNLKLVSFPFFLKTGNIIKVTYIELFTNGELLRREFIGRIISLIQCGKNSSLIVKRLIKNIVIEKKFYIFSNSIISIRSISVKMSLKQTKSKYYFLRLLQHRYKNKIKK